MSKTVSIALKAHYALGSTTIARCWRFERRDGEVVTVTTCAHDLLINGEIYRSKEGVNPTALEQQSSAAVPNSEINGTLSSGFATEQEILEGLWDGASVEVFEVNYRDLSQGRMVLQVGTLGDVKAGRISFNAEVRGLSQALQQTVGAVYTKNCTANFGDGRCKVDLAPITVTGTLTSVASRRSIADSGRAEPIDYFTNGVFRCLTGANAGAEIEISSFEAGGIFILAEPLPSNPAAGDGYEAVPGCQKRLMEDCKAKWDNVINFRGFPNVPGSDSILGLGGTEGTRL